MSKKNSALIALGLILVLTGVFIGIWLGTAHAEAKRYNLVKVDAGTLPVAAGMAEEGFEELPEMTMHYLRYGNGNRSVVLIHGNGGGAHSLVPIAEYLAEEYTVYCIADRCQGKSSDPGVISYELMAKDVFEFIQKKNLDKPFVAGHSDGGMVAIALASNYPESIDAFVSFGANSHPSKFKMSFRLGVKINNLFHKDKLNDLMLTQPDFNPEYLSRITAKALVVAGENDIMPLSDTVYIHENVKGSRIAVVAGGNHSNYVCDGRGYRLIKNFFDEIKMEEKK